MVASNNIFVLQLYVVKNIATSSILSVFTSQDQLELLLIPYNLTLTS